MKRLCFLLLLSSMALGQGVILPPQQALKVVNGITSPIPNATITVCAANTSGIPCAPALVSALFKDAALTQPLPNPFTTDANGNYSFAMASGTFTVTVSAATFVGYSYQVTVPLAAGANLSFTGSTTFTGTANLNGGGALTGTFGGAATFNGTNFFSGAVTNCNFNGWLFNTSSCFSGADIGAQFNTAYGVMPGNGTRFHVPASSSTYSFTTPMVATNTSNSVMLSCPVEQSATLTFTPTTGTALTLAGGGGSHNEGGVQVENCTFYGAGNGNTTTGLQLGSGTNGLSGATFKSIVVGRSTATGFGTGINFNSANINAYLAHFYNSKVIGNNVGVQLCGEGINFYGGLFGSNVTGAAMGGASNCNAQVHFHGVSFDDNSTVGISMTTTGGNTNVLNCTACHFENVGLGTDNYLNLTSTSSFATLIGSELNDDRTSGTSSGFVTASAGQLAVFGTTLAGGTGSVNTQAFNLSGNVNAILFPLQLTAAASIPNIVTPAYLTPAGGHGAVALLPTFNTGNTLNFLMSGTGFESVNVGPGIDLVGQEASGKCFRVRENAGLFEWLDCGTRAAPSLRGRLVGANFNTEVGAGIYTTTAVGAAACTNGELALSAGWQSTGSATVTAVAGQGQTCSWTITTGTTTAANPTVTDTVTNPLPSAAVVCEMNIHGGTHTAAAGEGFQQTALSSTAPVFTFNGTPTAGGTTYFVTRRCGP